jgi:hypothetical protein
MSLEIIISIAAAIILLMLFSWSIKVFKITVQALLPIVAILLLLQIGFGVSSQEIIQESVRIVKEIQQLILGH